MLKQSAKPSILCFVLYLFIIQVIAKWEQVESCPRGKHRIKRQSDLCGNASSYHCIPDDNCQLHQFCADPQESLVIDTLFISNHSIFVESIKNISSTNTELYGDLSLYFCKYSSREILNDTLYTNILKRLDTKADYNSFKQHCRSPDDEHVLSTLDSCEIRFKCAQTRKVMDFKLLVFHNGELLSHEFEMGLSNRSDFYKVGFLLCFLNNKKLYEYKLDIESDSNATNASSSRLSDKLSPIGIIAGVLVPVIAILTSLFFFAIYFVRKKICQGENIELAAAPMLSTCDSS